MNKTLLACALAIAGIAGTGQAAAANIIIVNVDPPGVGLNDPQPLNPKGGNPGTTLGEQRRIVLQFAADQWGALLQSNVDIKINASFASLSCDEVSGDMVKTIAPTTHANFPNAPIANSFYRPALANALAGLDLSPFTPDMQMTFQVDLGKPGCLEETQSWYEGLDGANNFGPELLDMAMHEMAHGLGFQGDYNLATGAPPALNRTDIYSTFVFDNAASKMWTSMTNAQRKVAAKTGALVWLGPNVTRHARVALDPTLTLVLTGKMIASHPAVKIEMGPAPTPNNFTVSSIVYVNDGIVGDSNPPGTIHDACQAMAPGSLSGKIALIDNNEFCSRGQKIFNAQKAGATKVILVAQSNVGFPDTKPDASPGKIVIPAIGITNATGAAIKSHLPGVNGAVQFVPNMFAGTDNVGHVRLHASSVVDSSWASDSAFSHFDQSLSPAAVMGPISSHHPVSLMETDAAFRLDLTPALLQDLGWVLNNGNGLMVKGTCNSGVKALQMPGLIAGANLQAADRMCRAKFAFKALYSICINGFADRLVTAGLIPSKPAAFKACAKL